jgi:hypothetical protein
MIAFFFTVSTVTTAIFTFFSAALVLQLETRKRRYEVQVRNFHKINLGFIARYCFKERQTHY